MYAANGEGNEIYVAWLPSQNLAGIPPIAVPIVAITTVKIQRNRHGHDGFIFVATVTATTGLGLRARIQNEKYYIL